MHFNTFAYKIQRVYNRAMKRNKIFKILSILVISFLLTGCMQMTSNYRVFSDGTYQSELEILIPEETWQDESTNTQEYVSLLLDEILVTEANISQETIVVDNVEYHEIIITSSREIDDAAIEVIVDEEAHEVLFTHDLSVSDDLLFDLDAFDLGDDYKEVLALQGFMITERIQMPGEILRANCGRVEGDILTVDIIEEDVNKIIVRSAIASNVSSLFLIFTIVTVLLVCLIAIYISYNASRRKKRKKSLAEPNIDIATENLPKEKNNDILETLALEEKEDERDFPY